MTGDVTTPEWYLVHTKAGKEASVHSQLSKAIQDTLLPTLKVQVHRWGKLVTSVQPLFPCYLFARFVARCDLRRVGYTYGVRDVVRAGEEPLVVPNSVIVALKDRCARGPVELPVKPLREGEPVTVTNGAFRGFDAVFEHYLSGPQRVAILLSSLTTSAVRVVLPASSIIRGAK
jgi:transcriptional antiterminator RfaH